MKRSHAGVGLSIAAHAAVGVVVVVVAGGDTARLGRWREPVVRAPDPLEVELVIATEMLHSAHANRASSPSTMTARGGGMRRTPKISNAPSNPPSNSPSLASSLAPGQRTAATTSVPPVQAIDHIADRAPTRGTPATTMPARSQFTMRIHPDGTAHLTDRPNLRFALGRGTANVEEARAERWLEAHREQSNAVDMKVRPVGPAIATFDLTDWAMRATGGDPYAHAKLAALDATRDERARIGARHREQQALRVPALVRARLATIVALPSSDERSAALLELWRDCDDTPAGEVAHLTIVDYVRSHAAFSSADRAALTR